MLCQRPACCRNYQRGFSQRVIRAKGGKGRLLFDPIGAVLFVAGKAQGEISTLDPRLPQTGGEFQIRLARTQVPNRPRLTAAGKNWWAIPGPSAPAISIHEWVCQDFK